MAKKKTAALTTTPKAPAAPEFNTSEEIRTVLGGNPALGIKEVLEAVKAKFPGAVINEKSFGVAVYNARKKLGISGGASGSNGSSGRKAGATKKVVRKRLPSASRPTLDLAILQAAAKFLNEAGNAEAATEALKQVQALQLK